jgi:hypothetical protein
MITKKFDINILFNNFNILRKSKGLSKGEFNKLIGMANVYRPNYFSIGAKLLKGIQAHFPWVDEEWLLTPHNPDKINIVAEPQQPYQGVSLKRVTDNIPLKISDLIHKTSYILESDTPHKLAFVSIIEACYRAVKSEERIDEQDQKIIELEEKIKALAGSLPPAESG